MTARLVVIEPITLDLNGCARCHGDGHPGLVFAVLTHPFEQSDGRLFTHWADCPTNGEPILLRDPESETRWYQTVGPVDERPHSRACGMLCRGHGADCSRDCPTCQGTPEPTEATR